MSRQPHTPRQPRQPRPIAHLRSDARLFILVGFLLTAASLGQMTGYSLYMGSGPILFAGLAQGFSLGLTFVPLQLLALSTLPARIMSQGTAIRALMRMLGGSIGISILVTFKLRHYRNIDAD